MGLTPSDLRAAADEVRRSASFVVLAFDDVGSRSDGDTWRGPAADAFREGFRWADRCVGDVADGLRAVAVRLEARAEQLEAEALAAARAAEREGEEQRRREEDERARRAAGLPPRTLFGLGAAAPLPPASDGGLPWWRGRTGDGDG